ncbi:MAG: hypothetical protein KDB27_10305 [Planctomycetales bacterium]|nr:hypothetical protein [Planctomycetales bacterium]
MKESSTLLSERSKHHIERIGCADLAVREFKYSLGKELLINEYELQVTYRDIEGSSIEYVVSPPLSIDVK